VPIVLKSGSLNLLEPYGPVQACNGIALLPLILRSFSEQNKLFIGVCSGAVRQCGTFTKSSALCTNISCTNTKIRTMNLEVYVCIASIKLVKSLIQELGMAKQFAEDSGLVECSTVFVTI
jgi:hypothetical protein